MSPDVDLFKIQEALPLFCQLICCQIERWWRELHERLEMYFKQKLRHVLEHQHYDPHNQVDRYCYLLSFLFLILILFNFFYLRVFIK